MTEIDTAAERARWKRSWNDGTRDKCALGYLDEIDRQDVENGLLLDEVDRLRAASSGREGVAGQWDEMQVTAYRQENDRLKAELQKERDQNNRLRQQLIDLAGQIDRLSNDFDRRLAQANASIDALRKRVIERLGDGS